MLNLTPTLGLRKIDNRDPDNLDWGTIENTNSDILDAAFGTLVFTESNYILSSTPGTPITVVQSQSASLNALDMQAKDVYDLMPTAEQKGAMLGEGTPAGGNKYVTKSFVRPARKKVLFPEGGGTCLTASPGGANTGNLTANAELHSNFNYNYYKWLSAEATFQNYDISVQWRVPDSFLAFKTTANKALIVDVCTEENATTNDKVEVILKKDGVAGTSTSGEICSTVAANWYSERETNELIGFDATDAVLSTLSAGAILDITIRVSSKSSKYVKIGAVTVQYTG